MPKIEVGLSASSMMAPFDVTVRKAEEYAFDYVEFLMDDELNYQAMAGRVDEFAGLAAEHGLGLLVHLPFHTDAHSAIGTSDQAVREGAISAIKGCIDVARQLDAPKGVLHVETDSAAHLVDVGDTDTVVEVIASLDRYAQDHGFELCVENLPERYPHLSDMEYLLAETDVSLTIDTGHATVNGYESAEIASFVSDHLDRISHVHLNDNRNPVDEHVPFRAGTIDFDAILEPLCSGWNGTMTFEIQTPDFEYIELSKQKLERIIPS